MAGSAKKLLIVYISEVLHRFSDKNHKLTQGEIVQLVQEEYGLAVERKAVARNIEALQNAGVDIGSDGGYYLKTRDIDDCYVLGLFLAMHTSSLITASDCQDMLAGVTKKSSSFTQQGLSTILVSENSISGLSLPCVLSILQSMREKKKLTFLCPPYLVRGKSNAKNGKYVITPRALYLENGQLILAGLNQNRMPVAFNLLGISELEITPSRQKNGEDMSTEEVLRHVRSAASPEIEAIFTVKNEAMPLFVKEFGAQLNVSSNDGGKTYTMRVSAPKEVLKRMALSGGASVVLVSPLAVQDELVEEIIGMAGIYA